MRAGAIIIALCGPSLSSGLRLVDDADARTRPTLQAKPASANSTVWPAHERGRPIVDVVLFNGEQDMYAVRANELANVVDLFLVFEGTCTFTGVDKDISFSIKDARLSGITSRIHHVPFPCFNATLAWDNEASTRNFMQEYLKSIMIELFGDTWIHGAVIASDVDEVPIARKIGKMFGKAHVWQALDNGTIYRVRGPTYYYNTRCAVEGRAAMSWKGARIISCKLMDSKVSFRDWRSRRLMADPFSPVAFGDNSSRTKMTNAFFEERLLFEDGDQEEDDDGVKNMEDLHNHGWHFSYFLDAAAISKKIKSFSHTEYAKPPFTELRHIQDHQAKCIDPYDRDMPQWKVPEGEEGTANVHVLPVWMKEAAMDGRLPKWFVTGSY